MSSLSLYAVELDEPTRGAVLARALLESARTSQRALLVAYALPGDVLVLGRYHVVPPAREAAEVEITRRLCGGRAALLGRGFVGLALALPHRNALVAPAAPPLGPAQILNRNVRGLLGALEGLGVRAYYPGRDLITVDGRVIASLGFEVCPDGAVLIEMALAVGRSFADRSRFADVADPAGVVPMDVLLPDQGSCVAELTGRTPSLEAIVGALSTGYADRMGVEVARCEPLAMPPVDPTWLVQGRLSPRLDRHATMRAMLGVIEVHVACDGAVITDLRVCGDLIAPASTVATIEAALRGAPVDRDGLRQRVADAVARDGGFILGLQTVESIGDLVAEACRS